MSVAASRVNQAARNLSLIPASDQSTQRPSASPAVRASASIPQSLHLIQNVTALAEEAVVVVEAAVAEFVLRLAPVPWLVRCRRSQLEMIGKSA